MKDLAEPEAAPAWPLAPVLAALVCGWVVLAWPWLSGRVTIPWDAKAEFLPQIQFLAQSLALGDSPLWNPFTFSGHPQVADPQAQIFSPVFLIMAAFTRAPSAWAVDVTVLGAALAGAAAMLMWFRDRGWHWAGGLLAGLSFAFGAAMAWRIQHTGQVLSLVYCVMTLWLLERALMRRSLAYGALAGLLGGCMLLGRDQVALVSAYLLAAYAVTRMFELAETEDGGPIGGATGVVLTAAGVGLAVIALPLIMTAMMTAESNRPAIDFIGAGRGSLHPALLLTAYIPDLFGSSGEMANYWGPPSMTWTGTDLFIAQNVGQLYVGAVPVLLVLLAAATGVLWAREIRFFTLAAGVTLVYALGWYTPVFRVLHASLPGVALYRRPADAVFQIGLLLAILAGYALHRLLSYQLPALRPRHAALVVGAAMAAFGAALALAVHFDRLERAMTPMLASGALVAAACALLAATLWLHPVRPRLVAAALVTFTVADLAYCNGPGSATALPPATYEVLEPDSRNETIALLKRLTLDTASPTRRDRVELAGLGFHWPNASMTHRLENTLGYNPLRLALYSAATGAGDHIAGPQERKFSALMPSYRSQLANLLGLRYIAAGAPIEEIDKSLKAGDLPLIARTPDAYVYENPNTLPRVLLATRARGADFLEILANGHWPEVNLATTVLLEDGIPPRPARQPGTVAIERYQNTEVVIQVDSPEGGWVVLNDVWQPWWTVRVDGKSTPLLRANVLFRAVEVPGGRHTVTFSYAPVTGALSDLLTRAGLR